MDLDLSADQEATRDLLRRLFTKEVDASVVRAAEPLGHSPAVWAALGDAGIPGMGVPAGLGGGGADLGMLVVAAFEAGRAMAPVPLVEHLVATRAIAAGAPAFTRLPALVSGESIAAWAPSGSGLVPGGAVAEVVVGVDGDVLVAVENLPPGAAVPNHASGPLAQRSLADGVRTVLGEAGAAGGRAADEWRTLTAAALAGLAARALDVAVAYVKERQQFGVPIGAFQALQHGLADLPGMVDGAWLLAHEAAWALDTGSRTVTGASPGEVAAMAFLFAGEAARAVTARCVQYHGGYGVAEEYDAQLLYRRARGWALVAGDPGDGLDRLAASLLAEG
ncbi:MAG TPA: acyl-CoA dehydrogenase [Acidimicrobiales bacterium]|nr:acyl-CoA dehydrogenase [Acidimicrobiales bacterium]